jgi:hypothetical protein
MSILRASFRRGSWTAENPQIEMGLVFAIRAEGSESILKLQEV